MSMDSDLITAQALAAALNLSVETIWRYTREQKIPYIMLGNKQYRYRLSEVLSSLLRQVKGQPGDSLSRQVKGQPGDSLSRQVKGQPGDSLSSKVKEQPGDYKVEPPKKLTYQDYLQLPEDGNRYEILEGVLTKNPSPSVLHQRVSRRLQRILEDYLAVSDPSGEVFSAPLDVTLGDYSVVQPDIFYMAGGQEQLVLHARIDGPPMLVVEVMSPSTSRKDRVQKMRTYLQAKVPHYWLVNPEEQTMEFLALRDGIYATVASGMDDDVIEFTGFAGLSIPLKTLW